MPVEGLQLIIRFPPQIAVHTQVHARPEIPKRPEKTDVGNSALWAHRLDNLQRPEQKYSLTDLLRPDPLKPEVHGNTVQWRPGDLQHHLPLRMSTLYLSLLPFKEDELEVQTSLRIPYEIHGKNLAIPSRGELAISFSHYIEQWHIVEAEEEKQFASKQKS